MILLEKQEMLLTIWFEFPTVMTQDQFIRNPGIEECETALSSLRSYRDC